jgi:hypothetical protein
MDKTFTRIKIKNANLENFSIAFILKKYLFFPYLIIIYLILINILTIPLII